MMPFYYKHRKCLAIDSTNIETKEDQNQEEGWMSKYPYDKEIQILGRKYYCKRVKRSEQKEVQPNPREGYRLRDATEIYEAILPYINPLDDLAEIRVALGLPDDTPESLVGIIWRLQQRIEDLEEKYGGE